MILPAPLPRRSLGLITMSGSSASSKTTALSRGSIWHRWDPHIHTPGTVLNDQFKGTAPWEAFLEAIENSAPPIRAIGITDYYLTDNYKTVLEAKQNGRLPDVELIFPNVEVRLDIATVKERWVNLHLLISPSSPDHLTQLNRFLARLNFRAYGDSFSCTRDDLIALGQRTAPLTKDDGKALAYGAEQFKVDFNQLREEFDKSDWIRSHALVAVAGGQNDGASGVRAPADATLRQEIESFANIIFSSSPTQREFWLGEGQLSEEKLWQRYNGPKPCLHGSDAHDHARTAAPDGDRFTWLKGSLEFDTLRQACIEPKGRAFVGTRPPEAALQSQVIDRIELLGADWIATPSIDLNPGLVAIIGARGSGKTALADVIAMACDAYRVPDREEELQHPSSSFLFRAQEYISESIIRLQWYSGEKVARRLDGSDGPEISYPRARYLSQQFVEELCSARGLTDALLREIERVIFESRPLAERDGAIDFQELLALRASRYRLSRSSEEAAIVSISNRIGVEFERHRQIGELKKLMEQKQLQVVAYEKDRSRLISKGSEERAQRLSDLAAAAEKVRGYLRYYANQERALLELQDEVKNLRTHQAPENLRRTKERFAASRMKPAEWEDFLLDYKGDVDSQLERLLANAKTQTATWKGKVPSAPEITGSPFVDDKAKLDELPLSILNAEIGRLEELVNADSEVQKRFSALSKKISEETTELGVLKEKLDDACGASGRIKELQQERSDAYQRVFEAIVAEQKVLLDIYDPLMKRLSGSGGTLGKLGFTVSRTVDFGRWCEIAEDELLDLRRQGPFRGKGNLKTLAESVLKEAWESGTPAAACEAIARFREKYEDDLLAHSTVPKANHADYRSWLRRFAQWLFSTEHIQLQYGITYDGIEIGKLSPGTRGIVLLLIYLALDDADDRPLIIDQPEENLDPKSVFDELVKLFVDAKCRRQVIIVTHNANLVINTDADQIIVADAAPHSRGQLPIISYKSGGLENAEIRKLVCDILEGGEHAFRERARRLRVSFGR